MAAYVDFYLSDEASTTSVAEAGYVRAARRSGRGHPRRVGRSAPPAPRRAAEPADCARGRPAIGAGPAARSTRSSEHGGRSACRDFPLQHCPPAASDLRGNPRRVRTERDRAPCPHRRRRGVRGHQRLHHRVAGPRGLRLRSPRSSGPRSLSSNGWFPRRGQSTTSGRSSSDAIGDRSSPWSSPRRSASARRSTSPSTPAPGPPDPEADRSRSSPASPRWCSASSPSTFIAPTSSRTVHRRRRSSTCSSPASASASSPSRWSPRSPRTRCARCRTPCGRRLRPRRPARSPPSPRVVIPAAVSGLVAAFIVAVSRAIGETMVVLIAGGAGRRPGFAAQPARAGPDDDRGHGHAGAGHRPGGRRRPSRSRACSSSGCRPVRDHPRPQRRRRPLRPAGSGRPTEEPPWLHHRASAATPRPDPCSSSSSGRRQRDVAGTGLPGCCCSLCLGLSLGRPRRRCSSTSAADRRRSVLTDRAESTSSPAELRRQRRTTAGVFQGIRGTFWIGVFVVVLVVPDRDRRRASTSRSTPEGPLHPVHRT